MISLLSLNRFDTACPRSRRFRASSWEKSGRGEVSNIHSEPTLRKKKKKRKKKEEKEEEKREKKRKKRERG
jgi:hypothetical protein